MSTFLVRPRVADLQFQLFGRPLHPELFELLATRTVTRDRYQLTLQITRNGHFVSWRNADLCLAEVADPTPDLAYSRRLLHYRLRGEHAGTVRVAPGLTYQMSFQAETLPSEIFAHVHDEILADGAKRGLLHQFRAHHRLGLSPLGYLAFETRPDCLFWSAFHTFPEENTVIKSQSLLEMKS
jgi:hypothetical protein